MHHFDVKGRGKKIIGYLNRNVSLSLNSLRYVSNTYNETNKHTQRDRDKSEYGPQFVRAKLITTIVTPKYILKGYGEQQ